MSFSPLRLQLGIVGAFYAVALATAAALVFMRYMLYVRHPDDAAAAGGMFAAGDLMLFFFIVCMLLAPTLLLAWFVRGHEMLSVRYAKALLGLSLTAPICSGILAIPAVNQGSGMLGWICMYRQFSSPLVIVALIVSRVLA